MHRLACLAFVLTVAGCPSPGSVIHTCSDAVGSPGAACDFTDTCRSGCGTVSCVDGRVSGAFECSDARMIDTPPSDAGMTALSCTDAEGLPDGAACDFTETCPGMCSEQRCVGGALVTTSVGCDAAVDAPVSVDAPSCTPVPGPTDCRDGSECRGGFETCLLPGDTLPCGICFEPEALCVTDTDCSSADVCVTFEVRCSCGGLGSACQPRCTEGSCAEGELCDTGSGHCHPAGCETDGYACPSQHECVPTSPAADEHGCARKACSEDGACGCGVCLGGACYDDFGMCSAIPA